MHIQESWSLIGGFGLKESEEQEKKLGEKREMEGMGAFSRNQ